MQKLIKIVSGAGICSRREALLLIKDRHVKVDNVIIDLPASLVSKDSVIEVLSKVIAKEPSPRMWIYYKPVGLITTHKDTHGRDTVFGSLVGLPRVISIGRLDLNSEGLLLLTNNGNLARRFELPVNKIERVYKVRAHGNPNQLLKNYRNIEIDGIYYNPKSIKLITSVASNSWLQVVLTEGKNREIRKIFDFFGLKVNRLIRINYGEYSLGKLQPNEYKELSIEEFQKFL